MSKPSAKKVKTSLVTDVRWEWKNDYNQWSAYTKVDSDLLETAYQQMTPAAANAFRTTAFSFNAQFLSAYRVDFTNMLQHNEESGTTRQIRRVSLPSVFSAPLFFSAPATFQSMGPIGAPAAALPFPTAATFQPMESVETSAAADDEAPPLPLLSNPDAIKFVATSGIKCLGGCGFGGGQSGHCSKCWQNLTPQEKQQHTQEQAILQPERNKQLEAELAQKKAAEQKEWAALTAKQQEEQQKHEAFAKHNQELKQQGQCSCVDAGYSRNLVDHLYIEEDQQTHRPGLQQWSCGLLNSIDYPVGPQHHQGHTSLAHLQTVQGLSTELNALMENVRLESEGSEEWNGFFICPTAYPSLLDSLTGVDTLSTVLATVLLPPIVQIIREYCMDLSEDAVRRAFFPDATVDVEHLDQAQDNFFDHDDEEQEEEEDEEGQLSELARKRKATTLLKTKTQTQFRMTFPAGARGEGTQHRLFICGATTEGDIIGMQALVVWT
eukprot:gb/GEZN01005004.1/.p1 GENE.gb/GEZN01005004.1/~~gb/GEZN01005004.1/.p1  ORF type:complete len:493 (-),score=103.87 gb/GEZN01005004.1/:204-1682(-)